MNPARSVVELATLALAEIYVPTFAISLPGRLAICGTMVRDVPREEFQVGVPNPLPKRFESYPFAELAGTVQRPVDRVVFPWAAILPMTGAPGDGDLVDLEQPGVPVHGRRLESGEVEIWVHDPSSSTLAALTIDPQGAGLTNARILTDRLGEGGWTSVVDRTIYASRNGQLTQLTFSPDWSSLEQSSTSAVGYDSAIVRRDSSGQLVAVGRLAKATPNLEMRTVGLRPSEVQLVFPALNNEMDVALWHPFTGTTLASV